MFLNWKTKGIAYVWGLAFLINLDAVGIVLTDFFIYTQSHNFCINRNFIILKLLTKDDTSAFFTSDLTSSFFLSVDLFKLLGFAVVGLRFLRIWVIFAIRCHLKLKKLKLNSTIWFKFA